MCLIQSMINETVPSDLIPNNAPSVMKWASNKIQNAYSEMRENYTVESWTFRGKFGRRPKDFGKSWQVNGIEYYAGVAVIGGNYKGQKATVQILFQKFLPR